MRMKKKILFKKVNAFNMQELLTVLVIIGILILIALPNLMPLISKAKALEAKTNLVSIYSSQRNYFFMNSKYSNNLNDIDYLPNKTVKNGGAANYEFEITESI